MGITSLPEYPTKALWKCGKKKKWGVRWGRRCDRRRQLIWQRIWPGLMIVSIIAHVPALCTIAHGTDLRFEISDLMANRSNAFGALDACLSFGHSSGRPPGFCSLWREASWRHYTQLSPWSPCVCSCDNGKLWLSWKMGEALKVSSTEHGSLAP